jgi:hypothetical protein
VIVFIQSTQKGGIFMANNYTDTTDTDFQGISYNIKEGKPLSAESMRNALHTKENVANKKDTINDSSTEYPSSKAVFDALAQAVRELETQVYAANNALRSKQDGLPLGTILMYDGAGWQDNVTLPGWYSCNRTNYNNGVTPDLEDKFIKGKGSLANTGGSNALTAAMLPKHAHSITTTATNRTLTGTFAGGGEVYGSGMSTSGIVGTLQSNSYAGRNSDQDNDNWGYSIDARHEHTGGANSDNSTTTDSNTSNMPAYYSLIYIKRV